MQRTRDGVRLPPLPVQIVTRPDVFDRAVATVAAARVTALVGMAGVGKSTLARQVIGSSEVTEAFSDGARWLKVGADAEIEEAQAALARLLGGNLHGVDKKERHQRLREMASAMSVLIVLDDVWSREVFDAIDVSVGGCGVIVTTRDAGVVDMTASKCSVGLIDDSAARRVLAAWVGTRSDELPPVATTVVERCGGVPVALAAAGGMIATGSGWGDVVNYLNKPALSQVRIDIEDYPYPTVLAAVEASIRALPSELRDAYMTLVVFDGRGDVPAEVAALLLGMDVAVAVRHLTSLARRSLVQRSPSGESFTLYDLQFQYLRQTVDRKLLQAAHGRVAHGLLERWGGLSRHLPGVGESSFGTEAVDLYGLAHVVSHLIEADMDDSAHELLRSHAREFDVFGGPTRDTNLWLRAHDRIGDRAGFVRDVNLARLRAAATTATAVKASQPAHSAGIEVQYLLVMASLAEAAGSLPTWLPALLVRHRIWSVDRALADATARPAGSDQVKALADLIDVVPEPERAAMAMRAFNATARGFGGHGGNALAALALRDNRIREYIPGDRWDARIDELIDASRRDAAPAVTLLMFADLISPARRMQFLIEIATLAGASGHANLGDVLEARALTKLAFAAPSTERPQWTERALRAAYVLSDTDRGDVLVELAPLFEGRKRRVVLRDALRAYQSLDEATHLEKQVAVAEKMAGRRAARLVDEVVDRACAGHGRPETLFQYWRAALPALPFRDSLPLREPLATHASGRGR
jgi:NB-ARC domain-containing protein